MAKIRRRGAPALVGKKGERMRSVGAKARLGVRSLSWAFLLALSNSKRVGDRNPWAPNWRTPRNKEAAGV